MAPQVLHRVIFGSPDPEPRQKASLSTKPAILHGYRRHRVRSEDYPAIVAANPNTNLDSNSSGPSLTHAQSPEMAAEPNGAVNADTRPSSSASVLGTLVSGLTDSDVNYLDIFEGSEYVRQKVRVRGLRESSAAGSQSTDDSRDTEKCLRDVLDRAYDGAQESEEVEAETYVWVAGLDLLEDGEWDFESFKRDKMAWWVGEGGDVARYL